MLFRFENSSQPLVPWPRFLHRVAGYVAAALALDLVALAIGTLGFHALVRLDWLGAALDAAMILTGNGPVAPAASAAARAFQLGYALLGGIVFVIVVSVLLAPVLHRILHAFHLAVGDAPGPGGT